MNDARLDVLLAAADPLPAPLPEGIAHDAAARAARARIRSSRRGPSVRQITLAAAGFAALAALVVALFVAAPGRDATPGHADGALIAPADRAPMRYFDVPMLILGASHRVGWNLPHGAPAVVAPRPVIITFADTDCAECRGNVAAVQRLWATTAVGDLAALGVAGPLDGRARELTAWWNGLGATFPLAVDRRHAASRALGAREAAITILIDRESRIAARFEGALDPRALERAVASVLAEPVPPPRPDPTPIPGPVPPSALPLAVFDEPPSSATPPESLATLPGGVYADSIRLALTSASGRTVWVARGRGDRLATASTGTSGITVAGATPAAQVIQNGGVTIFGQDAPGEPWYLVGVVPDGYSRAAGGGRSVPIRNNAFIFEGGRHFRSVTLTGPAGTRTIGR